MHFFHLYMGLKSLWFVLFPSFFSSWNTKKYFKILYANHFKIFSNLVGDHIFFKKDPIWRMGKKHHFLKQTLAPQRNNTFKKEYKKENIPTPPHHLPTQCLKNPFTKGKRQKNVPLPLNIHLYDFKLYSKATYFVSYLLPIVEFSNVIKFKTLNLITFLKKMLPKFWIFIFAFIVW